MSRGRVSFEERGTQEHSSEQQNDYFSSGGSAGGSDDGTVLSPIPDRQRRASLSIRIPPSQATTSTAFAALQYLPMPVLVLSSAKTIVLANEAAGNLLGIDLDGSDQDTTPGEGIGATVDEDPKSATDILYGVPLAQLGLDLLQRGSPVFVSWSEFLETLVDDASRAQSSTTQLNIHHNRGLEQETTPTYKSHRRSMSGKLSIKSRSRAEVHDTAFEVVFSTLRDPKTGLPLVSRHDSANHVQAQMIVSVWATEDEQYFTLTFTASAQNGSSSDGSNTGSRTVSRAPTHSNSMVSGLSSNSSSNSSERPRSNQAVTPTSSQVVASPRSIPQMDFPPKGPPTKSSAPSLFSKINRLKDAILNSMSIPAYAMWKDETFGVPNKAAIKLLYPWIEDGAYDSNEQAHEFLSKFVLYNEDFSTELQMEDFPIMRLMRDQKPFEAYRVGMFSAKDGSRLLFDTSGEALLDDKGEFLGGLVLFQDVTEFANTINQQQKENESQFENLCNMIPVMIWRTTPEGAHDYYNDQWYTYTGLTVEESHGEGWLNAFHPDDLTVVEPVWARSLATGCDYNVEYRCKNVNGDWRWMLGRAQPMRDRDGNIIKWFGTCTDIDDVVRAREEARQTRAYLERIIEHARITLWAVDLDRRVSLLEGRPMWLPKENIAKYERERRSQIGMKLEDVFRWQGRDNEVEDYMKPVKHILSGRAENEVVEIEVTSSERWYRTRMFPLLKQERAGGVEGDSFIDGVVGVSMDITELRKAAEEVEKRNLENSRLMAQSVAAKEASKMKSQFLANMSHEIRTPIAGVIGMAELLLDDDSGELTKEQRDCAENIQRSANGLLTVINDILDFSKVESGRLDIEEVQFDLSVVIRDVNKMLSFAAQRKGLQYIEDIPELKSWKVVGDPGRLRQIITNLLTNAIKFTSEGEVTMRVKVPQETKELLEVEFTVEDTGIGIEDEVQDRLFKPFSQADSSTARRFGGTGLGLTISKNLVELMRGRIWLESRLDVGTKATFRIPFQKAPYQSVDSPIVNIGLLPDRLQSEMSISKASSDSGPPTPTTNWKPGHKRDASGSKAASLPVWPSEDAALDLAPEDRAKVNVLVVEDNAINQQIALKTIKKLGFPVRAVWNGKEALEYLESPAEDRPRPDVILMDVQMPVLDGYRATYTIRNAKPFVDNPAVCHTPIVAMTASAIQGDREKCEMAGMDDYLSKPVKKPNLERMLIKWAIEGNKKRAELAKNRMKSSRSSKRPEGPRNASSFTSEASSMQSPQEQLSSELDRLEFAHRAAVERSSGTANDRAMQHQQAEEKAIALRDDVLLESGDDPKTFLGRGEHALLDAKTNEAAALTTENVQKFVANDRAAQLRNTPTDADTVSSVGATMGDGPGTSISRSSTGQNILLGSGRKPG